MSPYNRMMYSMYQLVMRAAQAARRKRAAILDELMHTVPHPVRLLDVGGTEDFWVGIGYGKQVEIEFVILNLWKPQTTLPNFRSVTGDARALAFADQEFDIVFSNSVIEHVGSFADQCAMASEIQRVGRRYFVQTPSRAFPIEPHYLVPPYAQFWPRGAREWLANKCVGPWVQAQPTEVLRLLRRRELAALFPGGTIVNERLLGITKSLMVHGGFEQAAIE